ncbi:MAG: hypothetical protein K8F54_06890 [Altibacter sp.]|uniref:hypothetical protein n=1 Tax=Altibacter sp. TaxID=2024823 RepID=UPI001D6CC99D|nr:hypothetical protein [Altibacter sp.]MBZ0327316.1 hypothetical protein [Altibacter sp.]
MSTLVSILLAIVMSVLSAGGIQRESKTISEVKTIHCESSLQSMDAHFIIKDEQLFQTK